MARNQDEAPDDDNHIGLSAEEIAAMEDDDDEIDGLKAIAGDDDGDLGADDVEDVDVEDDPAAIAAAKADSSADAADGASDVVEDVEDAPEPEFQTSYKADFVDNFDARMQALADQKKDLRSQLNNGDIDMDAYEDAKDAIVNQELQLQAQNLKAQIAAEQGQQAAKDRWDWEQERFFADKGNAIYKDKYTVAMLDAVVKDLAQAPANAQRPAAWFLSEADRLVRDRIGAARSDKIDPKELTKSNRKPDLSRIPKSIGDLPSAELPETGEEEFGHLEKLSGLKLEAAIAKMSPAQQSRYLGLNDE